MGTVSRSLALSYKAFICHVADCRMVTLKTPFPLNSVQSFISVGSGLCGQRSSLHLVLACISNVSLFKPHWDSPYLFRPALHHFSGSAECGASMLRGINMHFFVIKSQMVSTKYRCKWGLKHFVIGSLMPHTEVVDNACDYIKFVVEIQSVLIASQTAVKLSLLPVNHPLSWS